MNDVMQAVKTIENFCHPGTPAEYLDVLEAGQRLAAFVRELHDPTPSRFTGWRCGPIELKNPTRGQVRLAEMMTWTLQHRTSSWPTTS